jgi:L-ascorbate metabolism protein UlaG (beta-lactamase superfamily)
MRSPHRLARRLAVAALALGSVVAALAPDFARAADGKVTVQWLGQSAFKITSVAGKVILVDPFLTKNPKTPPEHKDLAALGKVDLVLVTHAHGDHVGGHFVMSPEDAAHATRHYLKPRFAIPMHYGTNPMLKGTPEAYVRALGQTETKVLALSPGEQVQF